MDSVRVQRMLELGRLKRESQLTDELAYELDCLRQEYLKDFRSGFQQQLDHVYLQQEDGSYEKLRRKDERPPQEGAEET